MTDRLGHHAEILALKRGSHRLKDRALARPTPTHGDCARRGATGRNPPKGQLFNLH